jgi:uncharacterized integral membrane protein
MKMSNRDAILAALWVTWALTLPAFVIWMGHRLAGFLIYLSAMIAWFWYIWTHIND